MLRLAEVAAGIAAAAENDAFPPYPGSLQLPSHRQTRHRPPLLGEITEGTEIVWRYDAPLHWVLGVIRSEPRRPGGKYVLDFTDGHPEPGRHELDLALYGTDSTKGQVWVVLEAREEAGGRSR